MRKNTSVSAQARRPPRQDPQEQVVREVPDGERDEERGHARARTGVRPAPRRRDEHEDGRGFPHGLGASQLRVDEHRVARGRRTGSPPGRGRRVARGRRRRALSPAPGAGSGPPPPRRSRSRSRTRPPRRSAASDPATCSSFPSAHRALSHPSARDSRKRPPLNSLPSSVTRVTVWERIHGRTDAALVSVPDRPRAHERRTSAMASQTVTPAPTDEQRSACSTPSTRTRRPRRTTLLPHHVLRRPAAVLHDARRCERPVAVHLQHRRRHRRARGGRPRAVPVRHRGQGRRGCGPDRRADAPARRHGRRHRVLAAVRAAPAGRPATSSATSTRTRSARRSCSRRAARTWACACA